MPNSFLPSYNTALLEKVLEAICQQLEADGLIPKGQAAQVKEKFLSKASELSIEPQEILRPDSQIRQNLTPLLMIMGKGIDLSSMLKQLQNGLEATPPGMKAEFNQLFEHLKKLEPNPQKKLMLMGIQHAFNREFEQQLKLDPVELHRNVFALFFKMVMTMEKTSAKKEDSLEEQQRTEAILSASLGHDPRGTGEMLILSCAPGNPQALQDFGDALGQFFVSARESASKVDFSNTDATGAEYRIGTQQLATTPIVTSFLETIADLSDGVADGIQSRINSHLGPRPTPAT